MKNMNKVILLGRLGADPILRTTKNGVSVANFSMATNLKWTKNLESGVQETKEDTQWHQVVVWGNQGEHCKNALKKGHAVLVQGSIRSKKYVGKDGINRTSYEIYANEVSFLGAASTPAVTEDEAA